MTFLTEGPQHVLFSHETKRHLFGATFDWRGHWINDRKGVRHMTYLALGKMIDPDGPQNLLVIVIGPIFFGIWKLSLTESAASD